MLNPHLVTNGGRCTILTWFDSVMIIGPNTKTTCDQFTHALSCTHVTYNDELLMMFWEILAHYRPINSDDRCQISL